MNGAEEAFCPAAHGFMQQSPWAKDLGVFLNLESTGPAGPDFLFQSTGLWLHCRLLFMIVITALH